MPVNDELSKRMKSFYEGIPRTRLMRRTPVIIRIDGKAFHTLTRGFKKPFDHVLMSSMQDTLKYLCENVQGCVLGYTQSDEISLLLIDYKRLNSSAWFDNEVMKMCSISASMATLAFNKAFGSRVEKVISEINEAWNISDEDRKYEKALLKCKEMGAMFDSRCFNIPKEEVTNYFYWRQNDTTRNSIEMVGQANFSHEELHEKTCNMIQDMLHEQKGINWNDFTVPEKRGSCCIKEKHIVRESVRTMWVIDENIPIFKGKDRNYIEKLIEPEEV